MPNQAPQRNARSCHASCMRRLRASHGRGWAVTFGKKWKFFGWQQVSLEQGHSRWSDCWSVGSGGSAAHRGGPSALLWTAATNSTCRDRANIAAKYPEQASRRSGHVWTCDLPSETLQLKVLPLYELSVGNQNPLAHIQGSEVHLEPHKKRDLSGSGKKLPDIIGEASSGLRSNNCSTSGKC